MRPAYLATLALLLLAGCAHRTRTDSVAPAAAMPLTDGTRAVVVAERFVTAPILGEELDSLATWTSPGGRPWLLASAKSSHRLIVLDAGNGRHLRTAGAPGSQPGEFRRPNGLAVSGDLLFVVERDNHRVQMLRLPSLAPVAMFGQAELRSPYGIWLHRRTPGALDVYVTDSFMEGAHHDVVPPASALDRRVHRFHVDLDAATPVARDGGSFGATEGEGMLHMVESIAGDAAHDRLLVADEYRAGGSTLRDYHLDGRFAGRVVRGGTFGGEAEGVALWTCGDSGYWIAVDQLAPLTRFHVLAREDLEPVGTFTGAVTAQTDGIALHASPTATFPGGVLYAVHDDRAIAAFDLRDVVRALRLDPACAP
ncbi:MAG TPA: phytase [Luteimonas sp.]|nr:phytase [Luteimonas sp.]